MPVLFEELNRTQINELAPHAIVVLPTAATEQHGPHMAVGTDTMLCTTVAARAALAAADDVPVLVTPPLAFGSSHHHFPFGATLSLSSSTFSGVVQDVLASLVRGGFRRLVVLNGHGGNRDLVGAAAQDLVHRMDQKATVASCNYWDLAKPALVEAGLLPAGKIPGHAGHFETAAVMALRPDWVDEKVRAATEYVDAAALGLSVRLEGAVVQTHGTWGKGPGYTDEPAAATAELGTQMLEIIVQQVATFYRNLAAVPAPE